MIIKEHVFKVQSFKTLTFSDSQSSQNAKKFHEFLTSKRVYPQHSFFYFSVELSNATSPNNFTTQNETPENHTILTDAVLLSNTSSLANDGSNRSNQINSSREASKNIEHTTLDTSRDFNTSTVNQFHNNSVPCLLPSCNETSPSCNKTLFPSCNRTLLTNSLNNATTMNNTTLTSLKAINGSNVIISSSNNNTVPRPIQTFETGGIKEDATSDRQDIIKGRNQHHSISEFSGNLTKIEFGTVSDAEDTNGTRTVSKQNQTVQFDMGNKSYALTNVTSEHNCSGCLRDENGDVTSLHSYKGTPVTEDVEEGSASGEEINMKRCKTQHFSTSSRRDIFDMFSSEEDDDLAAANINCLTATRRRLITNNKTHRKVTHSNGTKTEKDDKSEEEKNKERQDMNKQRAKSNEQRAKELELTKYKILNGIHDSPTQPPDTNDDRNIENKTMEIDPSMLPSNESNKEPPVDLRDANVGIVGMDTHPAIELNNKTQRRNKTKEIKNTNNETTRVDKVDIVPKKKILCFGDSITKGFYGDNKTFNPFSNKLEELLSNDKKTEYEVLNFGIPGACASKKMQARLPEVIKEEKPLDLVILLAGTNDLISEDCADKLDLYAEIKKLHESIHKMGVKSVVVTIPDISVNVNGTKKMTKEEFKEAWNELNQKLRLFVYTSKENNMILSDLADEFTRQGVKGGMNMNGMWADKVHPSKEGYDRIGEIIFKDIDGKF